MIFSRKNKAKLYLLSILFLCCTLPKQAQALATGEKRDKVDTIIIHSIGGPECRDNHVVFYPAFGTADAWVSYFEAHDELSIHYVIDKQGHIASSIPENEIANQAKGHNTTSIGIELVNWGNGKDTYTHEQIEALISLIRQIKKRWTIPPGHIRTHAQVDHQYFFCGDKRIKLKQDPGSNFPLDYVLRLEVPPLSLLPAYRPSPKQPARSSLTDVISTCQQKGSGIYFRVVVEDSLSVRAAPGLSSRKLEWLEPGEQVLVMPGKCSKQIQVIDGLSGVWVEVLLDSGQQGYVFSGFLEKAE